MPRASASGRQRFGEPAGAADAGVPGGDVDGESTGSGGAAGTPPAVVGPVGPDSCGPGSGLGATVTVGGAATARGLIGSSDSSACSA